MCLRVLHVFTPHTLLPMEPALVCISHILQMCLDRPPHLRVGICLLSCAKSLLGLSEMDTRKGGD